MTSPTGIPILDDVIVGVATEVEQLARALNIGAWNTAGPSDHPEGIVDVVHAPAPRWDGGLWAGATHKPAHAQRSGGAINPFAVVVHTTDMPPEDFDALITAWQTKPGDGACAHFVIGRDADHGVVQLVPINRNGNHAGGPGHGVFKTGDGRTLHPNLVTVGIEIHCAGGVRVIGDQWRFVEDGKAHGAPIPARDVIIDPHRPGRGWHIVTEWQYEQLFALLADLELVLAPLPANTTAVSVGEAVPAYAQFASPRVVAHASLDPQHRADPWPPTCDRIRNR